MRKKGGRGEKEVGREQDGKFWDGRVMSMECRVGRMEFSSGSPWGVEGSGDCQYISAPTDGRRIQVWYSVLRSV